MPEKHLFEYAFIRVVPRVEREEFVNVGVVVCCKRLDLLLCQIDLSKEKVLALDPEADLEVIEGIWLLLKKSAVVSEEQIRLPCRMQLPGFDG